jgi:kumamolisin
MIAAVATQKPNRHRRRPQAAGSAAIFAGALLASCGTTAAAPLDRGTSSTLTSTTSRLQGRGASSWWSKLLAESKNLGPSRSPVASVIVDLYGKSGASALDRWAQRRGLRLQWYVAGTVAILAATPARLGSALGVPIDDFRSPTGQRFYASVRQPGVPAPLRGQVRSVGRVTDYKDYGDAYVGKDGLTPQTLLSAYDATPLRAQGLTGAGETVVAFEIDGYNQANLNKFAHQYNLPAFDAQGGFTVVGGEAGKDEGESDMDLETVREIAPQAKIVYYNVLQDATASSFAGVLVAAFNNVNKEYPGAVWTLSIGQCEKALSFSDLNAENAAAAAAEAHGTTIFAASGDTAGLECVNQPNWGSAPSQGDIGVWQPAVLPAVTGVGGTTLSINTAGDYYGETTWYYPALGQGTSGGVSTMIAQPSWQVGQGLPAPTNRTPRRVPDIAAVGDPLTGNAIYEGGWTQGGGTSLATPIWAGYVALIDQYLHQHGKAPVGFINPDLYYFADHTEPYPALHPVTTGGNNVWRNGAGYNETTGLGSPDVYNLARDILARDGGQ